MSTLDERVAALEAQVAALTARLDHPAPAASPAGAASPASPASPAGAAGAAGAAEPAEPVAAEGVFWALEGLKRRLPAAAGAVLYTGVVEATAGERYEWQYGASADDLLADDWSGYAGTLTALAHPVRLLLLREVLGGRRSAAALAEAEGLGTSGQFYHHLRQLVSAGWLRATARGQYAVPPERVVPLLVTLTAARR